MAEERWRGFQNLFLILSSLVHRCGLRGAVVHVCIDQPLHASAVLSMHPFVHASAYPLIYIRESVDLYIDVSFVCSGHPFIFPFVGPTVPPSIYASMHVLVYVLVLFYIHVWFARSPIHFLVCVSVCLFTCLSISLPVRLVMFLCLCLFVGLSPSLCLSLSLFLSLSVSLAFSFALSLSVCLLSLCLSSLFPVASSSVLCLSAGVDLRNHFLMF